MMHTDPREELVNVGNKLLDLLYKRDEWKRENPVLVTLADRKQRGDYISDDEMMEVAQRPGVVQALLEDLTHEGQYGRLLSEYTTLRRTIEALERPRTTMPGTDA